VVRNGIDLHRFRRSPDARAATRRQIGLGGEPVVLCVARFHVDKGVDVLLRAVARARPRTPLGKARVLLVGDGERREFIAELARELGIGDRVTFMGVRSDLEQLYPAADVVVVPSRCAESCSLVTLESQACGVPVVASNVGGIPEHLQHSVGGLLVPPDDPGALAGALRACLENAELRGRLAEGGHHFAQQFALDRWVQQLLRAVDFAEVTKDSPGKNGQVI